MTKPPLAEVPIRSAAELTDRWAAVLEPPILGAHSLWLMWLHEDGRPLTVILPVEDMPRLPSHALLSGLLAVHEGISDEHLDGGGHLALALCRPGRPDITEDDDAWVGALSEVLDDRIEGTWSLHLAAGGRVQPLIDLPS
ncbi:hypothetical protein [Blastococcus sp. CT_GayMR16]|uniref:hypothetical protein n=1 Tax=Blastococcus sp. CT_GayMR16 TaxID=2559607 RepID=UPI001073A4BC|nr:hypothetical protein [Blastococcus sp. CT_GayMR16]TFV87428.1 hypothetical protein E4P38_14120 [Blastococcus sp. CT_GayMR16]